jgi:hypothetical protein
MWAVVVGVALCVPGARASTGSEPRGETAVALPKIVYVFPGGPVAPRRVHAATVVQAATIQLSWPNRIKTAEFFVDEPPTSSAAYAVDRSAPFVVPRRGKAGKQPYGLGEHTLRANVELSSGRRIRLQVAYLVARSFPVGATIDAGTLARSISAAPTGPLLVHPAGGQSSFSVLGDFVLNRPMVVIDRARFAGRSEFDSGSGGSKLLNSAALGFNVFGPDEILIQGNTFDGQGRVSSNQLWDSPAGNTPDRWVIRGNTFRNYFIAGDPLSHSEAIFVGYSTNGLIERNVFTKNGTTSHIFFSWFGNTANPAVSYPRNMCVRGNIFNETAGAYVDVNFRAEIPRTARIVVQRDASSSNPEFSGAC